MTLNDVSSVRRFLNGLPSVTEEMPFGPQALVYKILGIRMFGLLMWNRAPLALNLKCEPNQALILREQHGWISPGYHMNKQHWNTVTLDGEAAAGLVAPMICDSYRLVAQKLTRAAKKQLCYENNQPLDELLDSLTD